MPVFVPNKCSPFYPKYRHPSAHATFWRVGQLKSDFHGVTNSVRGLVTGNTYDILFDFFFELSSSTAALLAKLLFDTIRQPS